MLMRPTLFAGIDRDVRELYTRSGVVRDKIFSQRYMFRSLKLEQERTAVTFGVLWRPALALEAWAGHVDTWMAVMSRAGTRSLGESEETPLEETDSLEGHFIELGKWNFPMDDRG
ncbi:hypothetical protein Tco_1186475 [Tanacetum coccineum]